MAIPPVRGAVHVTNIRGKEGEQGPAGTFVDAHAVSVPADETDLKPILSGPPEAREITIKVPRGLPAEDAADNDAVQAARMAATDSLLHQATDAAFGPSAVLDPESGMNGAVVQVAAAQVAVGGPNLMMFVDAAGKPNEPRPVGWAGRVFWTVNPGQLNPAFFQAGDIVGRTREQFNPLALPGLVAFWDARSLNLTDGAPVTSWPNGVTGMPGLTGDGSAVFDQDALNGFPGVVFNGASGVLTSSSFTAYSGPRTIYAVARSDDPIGAGSNFIFDGTDTANTVLRNALARTTAGDGWLVAKGTNGTITGADTLPHVFKVVFDERNTATLSIDGVEVGSVSISAQLVEVTKYAVGSRGDGDANSTHRGPISAVVVIEGTPSPSDDLALTAFLRERYGF